MAIKKLDSFERKYFKINLILAYIFLSITLIISGFGFQYLYGGLVGLIGLVSYLTIIHFFYKSKLMTKKFFIGYSMFLFRVTVLLVILLFFLLVISQGIFNESGITSFLTPINYFVTIIFFSIPWMSSIVFTIHSRDRKVKNKGL